MDIEGEKALDVNDQAHFCLRASVFAMHAHWHMRKKGLAAWERITAVTLETTVPNCDTPT